MQLSDNEFFEEYKRLDKLCSEMYSCQNGVSEYIAQMEEQACQGQYHVSLWDSDYKMLKHIRWVRNQIAHDSEVYQISEPNDLAFVRDYYSRIFSGQDSLTLLRKAVEAETERRKQTEKQQKIQVQSYPSPHPCSQNENKSRWRIGVILGVGILVCILIMFYFNH